MLNVFRETVPPEASPSGSVRDQIRQAKTNLRGLRERLASELYACRPPPEPPDPENQLQGYPWPSYRVTRADMVRLTELRAESKAPITQLPRSDPCVLRLIQGNSNDDSRSESQHSNRSRQDHRRKGRATWRRLGHADRSPSPIAGFAAAQNAAVKNLGKSWILWNAGEGIMSFIHPRNSGSFRSSHPSKTTKL
jgi:hypothetical protein